MNLQQLKRYAKTRNQRRKVRKSRRASKRSKRFRRRSRRTLVGGSWAYRIPDEAVVGRTSDEGVEGFKTMKEVREEDDFV